MARKWVVLVLSRANRCLLVRWSLTFLQLRPERGGGGDSAAIVHHLTPTLVGFTQGYTSSYNEYCFVDLQGSQCTSSTTTKDVSSAVCFDLYQGDVIESEPYTCNDATCCQFVFCDNLVSSCSNLSYKATFAGTLSDGVVAGSEFSRRFCGAPAPPQPASP
jgi:hypothetical protein